MFQDRIEAGLLLAKQLRKYKNDPGIVLAVPRGGVPVAYVVAKELGFPVELILTKKIGHPNNREYAIGAASLTDFFVILHEDIPLDYIETEVKKIRQRLKEMYGSFISHTTPEKLEGKTVIVIDDGAATGNTLLSTVHVLRKSKPRKIVIAIPVASQSAVDKLSQVADNVVVLLVPHRFYGVGAFYKSFEQVTDEEVQLYLDKLNELKKAG
ncbi:phosphoribosyltransferase family protein [Ferruginibacter paludis]|uniref:phosphoribosyltransferase n=1 Tax=Ferruginibacter paludis TaxID=1310417 RepID=UPI0025B328D6|nr:phosphoribosyltransferase family protein [Ferruginibacter paludis]MDN3654237.1 phosphoribosyltransferase family protein [Ferruginibacter paludis]